MKEGIQANFYLNTHLESSYETVTPPRYSVASLIAQLIKNPPAMQETRFDSWAGEVPWRRDRLPSPVFLGFPGGSDGTESNYNVGYLGSIPGLGRSLEEGMVTHCSILAQRIPWTEEPGGLESTGSQRVRHD